MTKDDELEMLLQMTGDRIAALFQQLLKGNWTDDHGHPVSNNTAMLDMQSVLRDIGRFRHVYMGYEPFASKDGEK